MIDVADSNAVYYYHYDGSGSVVALSDSYGNSCQSYEYSAYGQVAASDPNFIANPYMYTGRRFDYETGLYYYRARYYNSYIGRFLQTDPIGYGDGINWYAYCGNNPLNYLDPWGNYDISISIPLKTVWDNATSNEYLATHPDYSHKIDVNLYLKAAGFYELYQDITLESVSYSNGHYDCVFKVPDDDDNYNDIEMDIVSIEGVSVLNVNNSEGVNTVMLDKRLHDMIDTSATRATATSTKTYKWLIWPGVAGGLTGAAGGWILIKVGAASSWHPIGVGMAVVGGVVVLVDGLVYILAPRGNIPNYTEIEEAMRRADEMAEDIAGEDVYIID